MRVLLDECLRKDLAREIPGHAVKTVPQAGWANVKEWQTASTHRRFTKVRGVFDGGRRRAGGTAPAAPKSDEEGRPT